MNKTLKLSGLPTRNSVTFVHSLFSDPSRIQSVVFKRETLPSGKLGCYALISFVSHSSARKTYDTYIENPEYVLEWLSTLHTVSWTTPSEYFSYSLFLPDPKNGTRVLPVDSFYGKEEAWVKFEAGEELLGTVLCNEVFETKQAALSIAAKPFSPHNYM